MDIGEPNCGHDDWYTQSIRYGDYVGSGANRWMKMTHVRECKVCGETAELSDQYTGDDHRPGDSSGFSPDGRRIW